MTVAECEALLNRLMDHALVRPLTRQECFLHGQLMAAYRMVVAAETLGYRGRFFVLSEDAIRGAVDDL